MFNQALRLNLQCTGNLQGIKELFKHITLQGDNLQIQNVGHSARQLAWPPQQSNVIEKEEEEKEKEKFKR